MRPMHIFILLLIVLLLFGAQKLPELARAIGKSARILKEEASELSRDPSSDSSSPRSSSADSAPSSDTADKS